MKTFEIKKFKKETWLQVNEGNSISVYSIPKNVVISIKFSVVENVEEYGFWPWSKNRMTNLYLLQIYAHAHGLYESFFFKDEDNATEKFKELLAAFS